MSRDYVTFEGKIEIMVWGQRAYTILRLPADVVPALAPARRVEGEFSDHPVNLAVTRAPIIEDAFLYAGKSLLTRCGLVPGDRFEVRLRPADPDAVEVPDDVTAAIRAAGLTERWAALSAGRQRTLLYPVSTAKRAATRETRIRALLDRLTQP